MMAPDDWYILVSIQWWLSVTDIAIEKKKNLIKALQWAYNLSIYPWVVFAAPLLSALTSTHCFKWLVQSNLSAEKVQKGKLKASLFSCKKSQNPH